MAEGGWTPPDSGALSPRREAYPRRKPFPSRVGQNLRPSPPLFSLFLAKAPVKIRGLERLGKISGPKPRSIDSLPNPTPRPARKNRGALEESHSLFYSFMKNPFRGILKLRQRGPTLNRRSCSLERTFGFVTLGFTNQTVAYKTDRLERTVDAGWTTGTRRCESKRKMGST